MKNKKTIVAITSIIVLVILLCVPFALKSSNKTVFQNKEEMSEIINGVWQTGDSEFDFVLTVNDNNAYLSNGNKADEPSKIVIVPDAGYFYYEKNGDTKKSRYTVIYENGEYIIKSGSWTFRKQK